MIIKLISDYAVGLMVIANIIFIYFYFMQLRETKKAIIYTKFIGTDKNTGDKKNGNSKQEILELLPELLFIENRSKNKVENFRINGTLYFNNGKQKLPVDKVEFINPYERILISKTIFESIVKNHGKLFKKTKNNTIPIKTLKIKLSLVYKWNYFHKQRDLYEIEWRSLGDCPDLKVHPQITSYNKRGKFYVEKIEGNKINE